MLLVNIGRKRCMGGLTLGTLKGQVWIFYLNLNFLFPLIWYLMGVKNLKS